MSRWSRRSFLKTSTAAALSAVVGRPVRGVESPPRPKVAVLFTEFTYRSHAHVILENFLEPYLFNGRKTESSVEVVALYGDQFPDSDMGRKVAERYGIPIYDTIAGALTRGTGKLAVEGVASIAEQGNYPRNELGQQLYPRKRFFDESVAVMRDAGRVVPFFNDKHLSYRWDWAREMYDTARELKMPFMAGSSVPLATRRPAFELPAGSELEQALAVHGGPLESYDFHGIELLQSIVEARKGGETGIRAVEFLEGAALERELTAGGWRPLAQEAMAAELGQAPADLNSVPGEEADAPHALRLHYRDGLRGLVLRVGKSATRWNIAVKPKGGGAVGATHFYVGPWNNRNLFKALSHAIQSHLKTGVPPSPVERTLLASGTLEAVLKARQAGQPRETPELAVAYQPVDYRRFRELGDTWKIITPDTPQPPDIDLFGRNYQPPAR